MPKSLNQFLFIVGPTAAGKTELSLRVAEQWTMPVINFDSVQVYTKVDIGSAKPTTSELSRAKHYLFDYVSPPVKQTAADYISDLSDLLKREPLSSAVFVGGSGFYLQAIEKGLYPNSETQPETLQMVEQWINQDGFDALYKWLQEKDPVFAAKISGNDHYRIKRAVEVMKSQDKNMTELKAEMSKGSYSVLPPHQSLKVGLTMDRPLLRKRVEARTRLMLDAGLVSEVEDLIAQGLENWAPLSSVGYREVQQFLKTDQTLDELFENIVTSTMQLIKKQMTWFRKDSSIHWFDSQNMDEALHFIAEHMEAGST